MGWVHATMCNAVFGEVPKTASVESSDSSCHPPEPLVLKVCE